MKPKNIKIKVNKLTDNTNTIDNKDNNLYIPIIKFEDEYSKELKSNKSSIDLDQNFLKELLSPYAPSAIKPNEDFYDYINYTWLVQNFGKNLSEKEKYITQIDDFRLLQNKVYEELNNIIENFIKYNKGKESKNLKNFYDSILKLNTLQQSKLIAHDIVNIIDELRKDKKNLWKLLAFANSNEIYSEMAPFVWSVNPDLKEPDKERCYISPHKFPVVDLSVFYNDGKDIPYKQEQRDKYREYVKNLFDSIFGNKKEHFEYAANVFQVNMDIFLSMGCSFVKHEEPSGYNKVTAKEALDKYGFDWYSFSKELGFTHTPPFFITSSLNYLKCGTKLFIDNWDSEKWRPYWIEIFIKVIARFTQKLNDSYYEYYGKFIKGLTENESIHSRTVPILSLPFNNLLSKEYIHKYKNERSIAYTKILSEDMKTIFSRIMSNNKWLSPSTKKYALLKLAKLKFVYSNYNNILEDPDLEYTPNELYKNMLKILNWRHEFFIKLEGQNSIDYPLVDWSHYPAKLSGTQCYIVNAFYTPLKNNIYIPLGYIQKPFVDLDGDFENNLAHLGFTLGHEMSHVLDDMGSQYDSNGALYDWWTASDKSKFKKIQNEVIKQYNTFSSRDGIHFDASISIGEDLADISGLAIVTEYLKDTVNHKKYITPIKMLSFRKFFTYYAYQMRSKLKNKKVIISQLKTNPHPLDKYRTNVPLSRSIIFRNIFNVKKGDGMYYQDLNTIW